MVAELTSGSSSEFWAGVGRRGAPGWWASPFVRADGARYMGFMRRASEAARKSYVDGNAELSAIQMEIETGRAWFRPVTGALLPAVGSACERVAATQARMAVVRAGLEAEIEYRSTGRYPERISARDPLTGKPLNYDLAAGRIASAGTPGEEIEWTLRRK